MFIPPFDQENISKYVARKRGISQEEVLAEWKENNKNACTYGTKIHAIMENYIKTGEKLPEYNELYLSFDEITGELFKSSTVYSELMVHNDEYEICGTADLIIDHGDEFSIGDFKTNKAFEFYSHYNKRLLDPIAHLSECQYNEYTLQLSLYAHFYSLMTGKKCRCLFLMYKAPDSMKWVRIPCSFMQHEIMVMLKYYQRNKKDIFERKNELLNRQS